MAEFLSQFRNFGLRSAIDIIVVAVVFYQFYMLIKRTRAVQLVKGVMVLLVVFLLAKFFQLTSITWLLDKLIQMFVIAIPVVFQPELRKALEQLGRGRFFTRHPSAPGVDTLEQVVEELVRCTQVLSKNRIGALIVLERQTGVQDFVETGIKIDGMVSSEFLVNIFIPNTPLHDGAVIIRRDRVAAAGCFLPLSENPNINKELGTRHRAALGLTEITDSLALVVSEETGAISIGIDGALTRFTDEKTLQELLLRELDVKTISSSVIPFWRW
ncbi:MULTISPECIES: diadenylate cyclase CdaA [Desulfosporosinus]|uniref:Diadenylate cyclase n=2 Tax=Desulfosporosinus TaxID=79206 RepID=A0A1M6FW93_9FIRM|nr:MULTISPECIES: diadenylate cyclase CdaA [Desulfosporosinus]MCO1603840.1 diadenylate cyclase CdaA [Desulfosporosinus nitroreducens]MDA8222159.1 diadenylate cyclase CdaA [Desulfitobacterium hafniense]MDO0825337.1 diadenylate cyclase CdaA [Desulfosporosinus nitroreducens]SHJ01995.1 diadenylate cyclase [Desulfosporosinus lacus DSM 15449]